MYVLVIGATGATGRLLTESLISDGHRVRAMTRDESRVDELERVGAEPVVADLEGELRHAIDGVDAVSFCAGSGSRTGADATLRVDLHGAVRTIDLCVELGTRRYLMLSSFGADDPLRGRESIRHYLAAKHSADRVLVASGLDATIVRPGFLTHDPGTGLVEVGLPRLEHRGSIPRADVAAILAGCLERPETTGLTFEMVSGDTPIDEALAALASD